MIGPDTRLTRTELVVITAWMLGCGLCLLVADLVSPSRWRR
jgi:hypothetical protein